MKMVSRGRIRGSPVSTANLAWTFTNSNPIGGRHG